MPQLLPVDYDPFAEQQPQEENLYWHHRGELAGGGAQQPTGERSTLYQAAIEGPGGRYYNVPTVWDGQILTTGEARDRAAGQGWRFPSYATPDAADLAYEARVHPRAAADVDRFENLHAPFPSAAEARGRELMQPGRDAITPLLPASDPNLSAPYDRSRSFGENALDPERLNNAMGVALGFAGGTAASGPRNTMLQRIEQLSGESLEERLGGRPPGYPRRSFSEIQASDKGELAALEPRSLYDRLPDPIRVYHGSGAPPFTSFDFDKIGTGEGHTTYSHGLYFGGAEGTGRTYRRNAAGSTYDIVGPAGKVGPADARTANTIAAELPTPDGGQDWIRSAVVHAWLENPGKPVDPESVVRQAYGKDYRHLFTLAPEVEQQVREGIKRHLEASQPILDRYRLEHPGSLYEADLYVDPARMLDWDAKLNAQSDPVKRGLAKAAEGVPDWGRNAVTGGPTHTVRGLIEGDDFQTGGDAYRALQSGLVEDKFDRHGTRFPDALAEKAATSARLRESGIEGARYLDQLSRYNPAALPDNPIANEARQFLDAANGNSTDALKAFYDSNPVSRWAVTERDEIRKVIESSGREVTHNYVTYSGQPIDVVSRNGQPVIPRGYNFRLMPVDHEPEF